jgi:hypothetical protein
MILQERVNNYHNRFPNYSKLYISKTKNPVIEGIWIMGNNYTTKSNLYGAYPHGYLDRINALFPDITNENTLHLFGGSLDKNKYNVVEINDGNDVNDLSFLGDLKFQLILADPPYSIEDCDRYGCCMINRNKVLKEASKYLVKGGFIVWLDQVLPLYKKVDIKPVGYIGMVKSTNHRFRIITIFQKQ